MTYDEFKELAKRRELNDFIGYQKIIKDLSELYDETKDFVFFYPRNVWNNEETELIFFLKDGYLTVKKINEDYQYKQFKCKVLSKSLIKNEYEYNEHQLKLKFDNGIELFFSSTQDTNKSWVPLYSRSIINLYKSI